MSLIKVATKGSALSCSEMDSNWDYVLDLGNATGNLDCAKIDPTSLSTCLLANPVIIDLQTEIDTANTAIGAVSQDLIDVQTTLQGNINALTTLVNNQNTTIAGLTTQVATLIAEFNDLTSTVAAFDSRLISLEGRVTTLENAIASGIILIWSGLLSAIPTGWQLSDGTNGSPDLRNRFILGAGSTYGINTFGGSLSSTSTITGTTDGTALTTNQLPSFSLPFTSNPHTHTLWAFAGGGNHEGWVDPFYSWGSGNEVIGGEDRPDVGQHITTNQAGTQLVGSSSVSGYTGAIGGNATHHHTFSATSSATSNLPPYYALAFIIRL